MSERKNVLLRLDPAVHDALARWAGDELRSTNAQIEFLLRRALSEAELLLAEGGGFEPPGLNTQRFSRPSHSSALPSLQLGFCPSGTS